MKTLISAIVLLTMAVYLSMTYAENQIPSHTGLAVMVMTGEIGEQDTFVVIPVRKPVPTPTPAPVAKKLCKPKIKEVLNCGDGSGGWIENNYEIIIPAGKEPVDGKAIFYQGDGVTPLHKKYCSASELTITRTGTKKEGDKTVVSYKVRVTAGKGGEKPIYIAQYCVK